MPHAPQRLPRAQSPGRDDCRGACGYNGIKELLAPAKTPQTAIAKLNEQLQKTLGTPEHGRMFPDRGLDVVASSPDEFAAHVKKESERWAGVVRERGMRAE